jgi:hypothetical protein
MIDKAKVVMQVMVINVVGIRGGVVEKKMAGVIKGRCFCSISVAMLISA